MSSEPRTRRPAVGERIRVVRGAEPRAAGVVRVFSDEGDRVLVAFDGERELRWCRLEEVEPEG
jgi:hypothetical protein